MNQVNTFYGVGMDPVTNHVIIPNNEYYIASQNQYLHVQTVISKFGQLPEQEQVQQVMQVDE